MFFAFLAEISDSLIKCEIRQSLFPRNIPKWNHISIESNVDIQRNSICSVSKRQPMDERNPAYPAQPSAAAAAAAAAAACCITVHLGASIFQQESNYN